MALLVLTEMTTVLVLEMVLVRVEVERLPVLTAGTGMVAGPVEEEPPGATVVVVV